MQANVYSWLRNKEEDDLKMDCGVKAIVVGESKVRVLRHGVKKMLEALESSSQHD